MDSDLSPNLIENKNIIHPGPFDPLFAMIYNIIKTTFFNNIELILFIACVSFYLYHRYKSKKKSKHSTNETIFY
jgi:hypothetical protein